MATYFWREITESFRHWPAKAAQFAQILIVCENGGDHAELKASLRKAGLFSASADSMSEGCKRAKTGGFQVIFTSACFEDGSWRRLIDLAHLYDLNFEVVVLAHSMSDCECVDALQEGVFDVLEVPTDLPRAVEAARSAAGANYLKRFRPRLQEAA